MLLYRESFWFLGGMDFIVVVGFLCFCFCFCFCFGFYVMCGKKKKTKNKKQKTKKDQNLSNGVIGVDQS